MVLSVSNDAGWQGCGLMAKIIEFGGEPPPPSGYDRPDITMMQAVRLLRKPTPEFDFINHDMRLLIQSHPKQAHALLSKHFYKGLCPKTDRAWTDTDRAAAVKQHYSDFVSNLNRAYEALKLVA